jgi:opacity protein-like surface antigen
VLARTLIFIGMLGAAPILLAQATSTASRTLDIQIGGGYSYVTPDSEPHDYTGGAAYANVNFRAHYGIEGEFHFAKDSAGTGQYEKTYEIGPRYFRTYGRFTPYVKVMFGRGVYNFVAPCTPGYDKNCSATGPIVYVTVANLAYNLIAGGGGVDYALLKHVNVRADWEYQRWLNFEGSSLSPNVFTVGAAYHF